MTAEQRKWYAMGANDMEAGRLVSERKPVHDGRYVAEAVVESLRERLEEARYYQTEIAKQRDAAEAKLAEFRTAYKWMVPEKEYRDLEAKLAEAEEELADRIKKDLRISGGLQSRLAEVEEQLRIERERK